jgi:aminopeptidase YwaD
MRFMLRCGCWIILHLLVGSIQAGFGQEIVVSRRGVPVGSPVVALRMDPDPVLQQLADGVDSSRIIQSLLRLEAFRTRYSSTDSLVAAKNWLISVFQEYGYSDISLHPFSWSGRTLHNVVVTKPGARFPSTYVLLIGHYDSISELAYRDTLAPGVNDNGSGIALMLEVARLLAGKQCDYSIRFICFSAEEQGLVGSQAYVQNVVVPENHDIKLVINVDEIGGYRAYANTMVKVERDEDNYPPGNNEASARYTDTLAALTRAYSTLTTTITNAYGSDYMSFENAGYVITGYYEGQETPHYHKRTDNVANVAPQYVYQITRGAVVGMAYFTGIQRKYLTVLHTPHGDTQDSSSQIALDAGILTSAPVHESEIVYRTNTNPLPTSAPMLYESTSGDTLVYRGFVPKHPYGTTVSYHLKFANGDTVFARFPADTSVWLTFSIAADSIPPAIVHVPESNRSYLDAPYEIRVDIADANGISLAWIKYRVNEGAVQTDTMEQMSEVMWRGFLHGPFTPGDRVEYIVYALDGSFSRNARRVPDAGWYSFRILNSLVHDFESSNGDFLGSGDWEWGIITSGDIPAPSSGERVWATNLDGNYSNNLTSFLHSPEFDLANKVGGVLSFKHVYRIEPNNDGGNVWVSVDSGVFQLIVPHGGYPFGSIGSLGGPGYSGNSAAWTESRFSIADLVNHRVRFQLRFSSDFLTNHRGWYIDDVRIDYLDSTIVNATVKNDPLPSTTALDECYPNPFNPILEMRYRLSEAGRVLLRVYDVLGREVTTLVDESKEPGFHSVQWMASEVSSGIYFVRMVVGTRGEFAVATRKALLLK